MRILATSLAVLFGLTAHGFAQSSCPAGQTTTISGVVYAPNGTDPLPNVTVYVPTTNVDPFATGVSCPAQGAALPGNPQLGTTTAVDGSFSIQGVDVRADLPVVIVSGRWRRQITVDTTANACGNTVIDKNLSRFPRNQSEGDIPKFAVATGSADQVECVLLKVGIDKAEFTNASGSGRINLFAGDGTKGSGGAVIDGTTPAESALMGDSTVLNQYDVLMLPCEGGQFARSTTQLDNLVSYANEGGRVYSSHYSYVWMWQNAPFNTVATWTGNTGSVGDGASTVDTSFAEGKTLASWLQLTGASTTLGQIPVYNVKRDFSAINTAVNQSWLTRNATGNPVMQFVFDTPVGATANQCGRVLFNEYHVENAASGSGTAFPAECPGGTMTPQEKLLEYSLFELTNDGGNSTLTPTSADFGSVPVNFPSAPQTFTFTNNSTFQETVSLVTGSGDFSIASNTCTGAPVKGNSSCQINVVFTPTALGARTGTLTVGAGSQTLTASLTGTGVPDLTVSPTSLDFGSVDVGATVTKNVTVTNNASGAIPMPALTTTGDYSVASACGASVAANSTCTLAITFKPTQYGTRPGTEGPVNASNPAYSQMGVTLTGNGLDFTIALSPISGQVIAGYFATTTGTVSPLAGFAGTVAVTCTTNAPGSVCTVANSTFIASSAVSTTIKMTTTSNYSVIGYGELGGGGGLFILLAIGSGWLLWGRRKNTSVLLRSGALVVLLSVAGFSMTGCSGKLPTQNANPTVPGNYTYTVTATDGTITHSATYMLNVTLK